MGTTLTGTTPQDTYDSLIKVTDNGPLSGTAKYLSDGLGNDSVLALSTARVGVATSSPSYPLTIVGDTGLEGNESYLYFHSTYSIGNNARARMRAVGAGGGSGYGGDLRIDTRATNNAWNADAVTINYAGNVGIGTSAPAQKLSVVGGSIFTSRTDSSENIIISDGTVNSSIQQVTHLYLNSGGNSATFGDVVFRTKNSFTEMARFTQNGLCFNGDTAAANALDDYEEGTWTMGVAFGGASVGVTTSSNTGTYTKIGRQVTVNGLILLTSKGSSTGSATITGLPFSIANNNANYSALSLRIDKITFVNQFQAYGDINTTSISLEEITILGVRTALTDADFANDSSIIVSFTYFV